MHNIVEEHKPLSEPEEIKAPLLERVREKISRKQRFEVRVEENLTQSP
jgi:hypothetical protein